MPGRETPLVNDQIYHVLNRGISFQPTFSLKRDFDRAIEVIRYYQNKKVPLRYSKFVLLSYSERQRIIDELFKSKEFLVGIIAYCLMPNHFHLILKQLVENGISKFMANLSDSYVRYFNVKHKRKGPLFQGRFKAVRVETDEQLKHLSRYVHLNPYTSYVVKTIHELFSYSYSSFSEYLGEPTNNFCDKEIVLGQFKNVEAYQKFVLDQADYQRELEEMKHLVLEG